MRHDASSPDTPSTSNDTVSRPDRADHAVPWAMQLVVYRNKQDPANHIAVLEAAASAVVKLLDDQRATDPAGSWFEQVTHWRAGWIRKVARRAENKRWDDVQSLAGVTAVVGTAAVRALVPGPMGDLPPEVKKLQVGGTEFPRSTGLAQQSAVVTVELTPAVELSTGKAAAQAGHAAQLAYERLTEATRRDDTSAQQVLDAWRQDGFRVCVQLPSAEQWAVSDRPVRVMDAGLTEVSGETETSRAWWAMPNQTV